jgi:predicted Fe-Mo cluster-binding NifX family protein
VKLKQFSVKGIEEIPTKVCMSTGNDNGMERILEQHLVKAPTYTIMDTSKGKVHVIANENNHMRAWSCLMNIFTNGVEIMLCRGNRA